MYFWAPGMSTTFLYMCFGSYKSIKSSKRATTGVQVQVPVRRPQIPMNPQVIPYTVNPKPFELSGHGAHVLEPSDPDQAQRLGSLLTWALTLLAG